MVEKATAKSRGGDLFVLFGGAALIGAGVMLLRDVCLGTDDLTQLLNTAAKKLDATVEATAEQYEKFQTWQQMSPDERAEVERLDKIADGSRVIVGSESFGGDAAKERAYLESMDKLLTSLGIQLTDAELRIILNRGGFTINGESYTLLETPDGEFQFSGKNKIVPSLPVIDIDNDRLMLPATAPVSEPPAPTEPPVRETATKYTLTDRDGITQGIKELRDSWPKDKPMPDWLKALDSREKLAAWAEANGWYKPGEVKDSVVMHKGDVLSIDSAGQLSIRSADRSPVDLKNRPFSDTMPNR